jgi:hypothetical protein
MTLALTFHFEPADLSLQVGFSPQGGRVGSEADVRSFVALVEARFALLKQKLHLFFDLTHLEVEASRVEDFNEARRCLCEQFSLSVWHFGGSLAERVMIRNDCTRRGKRPNLFRTREEAVTAFRKARALTLP